jgi:hypothetical protein
MATPPATIPTMMVGVPVRLHALDGEDVGLAHVPIPIEPGDMIATADTAYRVVDVVISPPGSLIAALVKVKPERLVVAAR